MTASNSDSRVLNVTAKPFSGEPGDLLERPWLFEQMGCPGHDDQTTLGAQPSLGFSIDRFHRGVAPSHYQQGWGRHRTKTLLGEVRAAPSGDDSHNVFLLGGSPQCSPRPRAGTEVADGHSLPAGFGPYPRRHPGQAVSEKGDIEDVGPIGLLVWCQQVEEECGQPFPVELLGDETVAGAMTAAPASVSEDNQTNGIVGRAQLAGKNGCPDLQLDIFSVRRRLLSGLGRSVGDAVDLDCGAKGEVYPANGGPGGWRFPEYL